MAASPGSVRWNQFGRAGFKLDRRVDAGAQIQPGSAGGGIVRQIAFEARVENFDVKFVHVWQLRRESRKQPERRSDYPGHFPH
jgi:hypothetical protein